MASSSSRNDVTVVTGTYNRLESLQLFVNSVRQSYLPGFRCNIVAVDGGSTDGTIEWCKQQEDIELIEQGALLGAIKAFNAGAYHANADYVILGNDDVELIGKSVYNAWRYMQDNPNCGIGCFQQNRNGKDWHVERMMVVVDGEQRMWHYGQVCIVPKWLGDRVGWWGDWGGKTYGGDNELSAQVYETGYSVDVLKDCYVDDKEIQDNLRLINNPQGGGGPQHKPHTDSAIWGRRWFNRQTKLMGPVVSNFRKYANPIQRRERIVYFPIFEQGWDVQKQQKYGLRQALERIGPTYEIDYLGLSAKEGRSYMVEYSKQILETIKPTIVLLQVHSPDVMDLRSIRYLKHYAVDAVWLNWNGDYWPENLVSDTGVELGSLFDRQLTVNITANQELESKNVKTGYWQIGFEPEGIDCIGDTGAPQVVFLANGYSQKRRRLVQQIRSWDIDFGLYGLGWSEGWTRGSNLYDFQQACRIYNGAKISIGDSQWPDAEGYISNRVMQAMAAGGSVFAVQRFKGMELLGLIHQQTVLVWDTPGELRELITYYLNNESERQEISQRGREHAMKYFSFDYRVTELLQIVDEIRTGVIDWR